MDSAPSDHQSWLPSTAYTPSFAFASGFNSFAHGFDHFGPLLVRKSPPRSTTSGFLAARRDTASRARSRVLSDVPWRSLMNPALMTSPGFKEGRGRLTSVTSN